MNNEQDCQQDYLSRLDLPRQQAVAELTGLIKRRYPTASFAIGPGEDDPCGTHITATVDLDDPDEVTDLVIERELEYQIELGVPVYVIPIRTPERVAKLRREQARQSWPEVLPFSQRLA